MAAGAASGGTEGIKAGRAYVEIGTKDAGLKAGLAAAKKAVLSVGKHIAEAGGLGLGLGGAIMAPILASLKEVVEHFAEINRAAIRTGATTEAISDLGYAAKSSGSSLGAVEAGIKFLNKNLAAAEKGSDDAKEALAAFGLTVEDLKGKDPGEQFALIAEGLGKIEETAQGSALKKLLGRGGLGLKPMLDNATELRRLLKENEAVGGRVSKEDAANAEKVEKAYIRTTTAIKNAFLAIGAAILPHADTIDKFTTGLVAAIRDVKGFIDENRAAVVAVLGVGAAIAGLGAVLVGIGTAVALAGVAIGGLSTLAATAGTVLAALFSPAGLAVALGVVAAVVAIAAALELFPETAAAAVEAWGGFMDVFGQAWEGIKAALAGGDLKLAFTIAVDALDVVWKSFLLGLQMQWVKFAKFFGDAWFTVVTEIKVALAEVLNWAQRELKKWMPASAEGKNFLAGLLGGAAFGGDVAELAGKSADEIRAEMAAQRKVFEGLLGASVALRAGDLAAALNKLAADVERAKGPPKELGPMPREVARQAALAGLGTVRGQMGGYGAAFSLGVSGEAIQKKQLEVLQQIEENTEDLGGVKGW